MIWSSPLSHALPPSSRPLSVFIDFWIKVVLVAECLIFKQCFGNWPRNGSISPGRLGVLTNSSLSHQSAEKMSPLPELAVTALLSHLLKDALGMLDVMNIKTVNEDYPVNARRGHQAGSVLEPPTPTKRHGLQHPNARTPFQTVNSSKRKDSYRSS